METMTYEEILERMKESYRTQAGCEADDSSDIGIRLRVLAGEIYTLYHRLLWLEDQMYPQTATGEYLDRHCQQRGISRKPASKAKGKLRFSRKTALPYHVNIPAGIVCAAGDSLRYITTSPCFISTGRLSGEAEAEAESGGSEYNCGADAITTLITLPVGVESVTNPEVFTGGMDQESDDSLRQRLEECCATFPDGANAAYYRQLAVQMDGVSSAGAKQTEAGKVGVYIWGSGSAPAENTISALQELFQEKRELNTQVEVAAATPYEYVAYLDITQKGCDFDTAREAVENAVTDYFSQMKVGDPVLKSLLGEYLLQNCPISNYRFPSSVADYKGDVTQIPVLKSVNVGELP